ncbi:histidine kinase-like ATPase [Bombardia bombarda]|uniref:Histidine kinase-like ATPase n=1 Tax=Bombardia bombarda TaxID=252184 RepID=A0AA39X6D2_9PEZI|nr:histidine kinase-like ATPase [Bombardia bombarda]
MPILPLPEATGRRLASTLAIPSAVMLIKELLENAIDAEATFVEVLVSPNTVDRIEVRDNGNGIHPEDFSSLGRLGHTSKLRSFDELTTIGGSSLGFRGVALASAKTVSEVSIKTRMATESVGSFLSLRGAEGAVKDGHKPAPVGTTVCVVGLFSGIPVRQRLAIKEAGKTMTKIRDMLKSYALARPRVKLQLKVLGNPSTTFSYAPLPNADFRHAASQIFGRELTSQCIFVGCPLSEQIAQHATHQSSGDGTSLVVFEGLIPMLTADTDKISRGFFFSVDSRPISSTKGTAMKLIAVFRAVFCQAIASSGSDKTVRNLFILVNLRCPLGSYDNNVEPSKDDVLFYDEQHVLSQFGKFLASNYSKSMHDFDRRLAEIPKEVSLETLRDQSCVPSEDKSTAQTVNQASSSATVDSGSAMGPAQMATDKQNTANEEQEQNTDCSWRVDMSAGDGLDSSDDDQDDDGRLSSPKNATDDNLESINTPDAHHEDNEGKHQTDTSPS